MVNHCSCSITNLVVRTHFMSALGGEHSAKHDEMIMMIDEEEGGAGTRSQ